MNKTNQALATAVRDAANRNSLPCEAAMELAERLSVSAEEIGRATDEAGVRLTACQLGLFGLGPEKGKTLQPASSVCDDLRSAIDARLVEGKLPCVAAWAIAASLDMPRMDVASACEALGVKISSCQLGVF